MEALTDEIERQAEAIFAHLLDLGSGSVLEGVYAGIDNGYFQGEIADAAYSFERRINRGDRIVVGVNRFTEAPGDEPLPILVIGPEVEERQRKRLDIVKHDRNDAAVHEALGRVKQAAEDSTVNLMPVLVDAATSYCTLGEVMNTMADVFGRYVEKPVI